MNILNMYMILVTTAIVILSITTYTLSMPSAYSKDLNKLVTETAVKKVGDAQEKIGETAHIIAHSKEDKKKDKKKDKKDKKDDDKEKDKKKHKKKDKKKDKKNNDSSSSKSGSSEEKEPKYSLMDADDQFWKNFARRTEEGERKLGKIVTQLLKDGLIKESDCYIIESERPYLNCWVYINRARRRIYVAKEYITVGSFSKPYVSRVISERFTTKGRKS